MVTQRFNTESNQDFLKVNGIQFSGAVGPGTRHFDSNFEITWASDETLIRGPGWVVCFEAAIAPPMFPLPGFTSGCHQEGKCFTSSNFPGEYRNSESCSIQGPAGTRMVTESFNTESNQDFLTLNDIHFSGAEIQFSGAVGPGTRHFDRKFEITWVSDGTNTRSGWVVCFEAFIAPPFHPVLLPESSCRFNCLESSCRQEGNCLTSGNFPGMYGNYEYCAIRGPPGTRMVTESFNTELGYDFLMVNENRWDRAVDFNRFAGTDGPGTMHFGSHFEITWASDASVKRPGWRVCFEEGAQA